MKCYFLPFNQQTEKSLEKFAVKKYLQFFLNTLYKKKYLPVLAVDYEGRGHAGVIRGSKNFAFVLLRPRHTLVDLSETAPLVVPCPDLNNNLVIVPFLTIMWCLTDEILCFGYICKYVTYRVSQKKTYVSKNWKIF